MNWTLAQLRGPTRDLASPLALLVVWQLLAMLDVIDVRFWPAPTTIVAQLWDALTVGNLIADTWLTTTRLVVGTAIGGLAGLVIGLAMGVSPVARVGFRPLLAMTYPIPKIAILPLFLLIFGLGEASKWAIVSVGVFYLVAMNTYAGVRNIDPIYTEMADVYEISRWKRVRTVALPGSLPLILTGFELGIGVGFLLVVAAEFVAANSGLGHTIWLAWQTFNIPLMYAGLAVVAIYGFAIQASARWLERTLVPWRVVEK